MAALSQGEPYLVVFLGAPGSGKGTQSTLLSERYRVARIETSKVLESWFRHAETGRDTIEVDGERFSVAEEKKKWEGGYLLPDKLVAWFVQEKLKEHVAERESVLLDGFPRTLGQMETLMPFLEASYAKNHVFGIYIDIREEEAVYRNTNRRICELMRHSVLYNEETEHLTRCPFDGSRLLTRALDTTEAIKIRLQEFKNKTLPLLEYFKQRNIIVHSVKAEQSPYEVFQKISALLENMSHE